MKNRVNRRAAKWTSRASIAMAALLAGCSGSSEPACSAVPATAPWSTMQFPVEPGGAICASSDKGIEVAYRGKKAAEVIDEYLAALGRQGFQPEGTGAADRTPFHFGSDMRKSDGKRVVLRVDGQGREGVVRVHIWKIAPGW